MENIGSSLRQNLESRDWLSRFDSLVAKVLQDEDIARFIAKHQDDLTEEDIRKSYAKMYEYVQEKHKFIHNDPTMIAPGYEPTLFLNFHFIDVTYVPTEQLLKEQEAAKIKRRVQSFAMPKDIRSARLSDFELTAERTNAFKQSLDFIQGYQSTATSFQPGLYLQGSFGVGKTFLLGAIANELAEKGHSTTLLHFPTFVVEMKQAISTNNVNEKIDAVKKAPLLMIDDIGADSLSSWIRDDVLGVILQYRMQEMLPVFFSSNLSMQQLEMEHLRVNQRGEDEPLKAKRIMERIRFLSREVEMIGVNRRLG